MRPAAATGGSAVGRRASRDRVHAVAALPLPPGDNAMAKGQGSSPNGPSPAAERRWVLYKRMLCLLCFVFIAALGVSLWFILSGSSFAKAFGLRDESSAVGTPPPTSKSVAPPTAPTANPTIPIAPVESLPPFAPSSSSSASPSGASAALPVTQEPTWSPTTGRATKPTRRSTSPPPTTTTQPPVQPQPQTRSPSSGAPTSTSPTSTSPTRRPSTPLTTSQPTLATTTTTPTTNRPTPQPTTTTPQPTSPPPPPTSQPTPRPTSPRKPHIFISLADDLAYTDVGFTGNTRAYTPRIDALADQGVLLQRHYSSRICSPSRGTLMTGRMPWKIGLETDQNLEPVASMRCGLTRAAAGSLLPEKLKALGYATHMVGKWHLGSYDEAITPVRRGFDTFLGRFLSGNTAGPQLFMTDSCACTDNSGPCRIYSESLTTCVDALNVVNATIDPTTNESVFRAISPDAVTVDHLDLFLANQVDSVVSAHARAKDPRPLFYYMAWSMPHNPMMTPTRFLNLVMKDSNMQTEPCQRRLRRTHLAMASELDEAIGVVHDSLVRNGLWRDTMFVFLTDNGGLQPTSSKPSDWCTDDWFGFNYPLRGGKYSWWEGGIRTPAFVVMPNSPLLGGSYGGIVALTDWYATAIEAAGGVPQVDARDPDRGGEDSVSHWTRFQQIAAAGSDAPQSSAENPRTVLVMQVWTLAGRSAVLWHDQASGRMWKRITGFPASGGGAGYLPSAVGANPRSQILAPPETQPGELDPATLDPSRVRICGSTNCLFDVASDPGEFNDLSRVYPDVMKRLAEVVRVASGVHVPYAVSGVCAPGWYSREDATRTDLGSLTRASKCDAFVPWTGNTACVLPVSGGGVETRISVMQRGPLHL